jgi:hypothetical protein
MPYRRLVIDRDHLTGSWGCRVEELTTDFAELQQIINNRRISTLPPLAGELNNEQVGPVKLAKADPAAADKTNDDLNDSPHAIKYSECGRYCVQNITAYYKEDFELLKYPVLEG